MSLINTCNKTLRIMKLIFIALLIFTSSVGASVHSQTMRVRIHAHNVPTRTILDEIEEQTDYLFIYDTKEVDLERKTSVEAENRTVAEVLSDVFGATPIVYAMEGSNIMLMKKTGAPAARAAQPSQRKLTGTVTDKTGEPIIGANVVIKGTTNGTVTDIDGHYSLEVPEGATLQFSYIGYFTQEIALAGKTRIDVRLTEDTQQLDEVVVVGYGTQKKGELTSSISSIKSENFIQGSVQDAAQLLQGKVAGLGVVLPSGDPTASTQIMLRGVGSLQSSASPLVIIDGVPGDMNTVAPEDIESIDVIKDGSAAAIYGTRGNGGVIFITTKKVKGEMPLTIDVQAYITTQQIKKRLDMMNADQYREVVGQNKPGAIDYGYHTDWLDEILRTPVSYVTNASLRGGNSRSNYIANVNYKSGQGIVKRSDNKELTTRLEINHSMWDNLLKFNLNILGKEQRYTALGDGKSFRGDIYRNALINNPTERAKDDEGNWVEHPTMNGYMNPVSALHESDGENKSTQLRTFGSVTLTPIDAFFIKALASRTSYNQTRGYAETKKHISTVRDGKNGFASRGTTSSIDNLLELTAQYKNTFGAHNFTGLAGYSYQDRTWENYWMQNWDFPSDQYSYNNMGSGAALKRGEVEEKSEKTKTKLIGFFARVNYSYDNRYLVSASIRHEGATQFGADHKWGNFPAFSLGWNISNEAFMQSLAFISNLKARAGFGVTGSIPKDPYLSLSRLDSGNNFLTGSTWTPTLKPASNANPDLRWEKKEEWNFGIDYGFLNDRIGGSFDFYKRKTKDMLWEYNVAMPPYLYEKMVANGASMQNTGFEAHLSILAVQTKDFSWTTTVNYSTNKNKVLSLSNDKFQVKSGYIKAGWTGEPIQQETHRLFEGGEVGNFYGFKTIDVDADGRWIIEGKDGKPKPIADQQEEDKQIIGNGLPKHFLSWDNSFTFRNFDLGITMRGAFDYDILNYARMFYECPVNLTRGNLLASAYEPKFGKTVLNDHQELQYVSYFIERGNFWKIDNITIGYTLNLKNDYLKRVRVYATANNLFTFTGYSGLDPEVNTQDLDPGCDPLDRYPSTRSFTLGAMFTF